MNIREAAKGATICSGGTYRIGFLNDNNVEDETEFDNVESWEELEELFSVFCRENNFSVSSVLYVVFVEEF